MMRLYYENSATSFRLPFPISNTPAIAAGKALLARVYKPGFVYHKAGIFLTDIGGLPRPQFCRAGSPSGRGRRNSRSGRATRCGRTLLPVTIGWHYVHEIASTEDK